MVYKIGLRANNTTTLEMLHILGNNENLQDSLIGDMKDLTDSKVTVSTLVRN